MATAIVTVQRLGIPAGMIGTYGSDRLGEIKLQTLVENKVDVSRMIRRPEPENHAVLVSVNEDTGERIFSGMFGQPGFSPLSTNELDQSYITSAEYLHLDGCHSQAPLQAARWMHAAGKPVMLDGSATCGPISPEMRLLVAEVDVLICGSGFAPALTGEKDPREAGKAILDLGPRIVVQTEGADGMLYSDRE